MISIIEFGAYEVHMEWAASVLIVVYASAFCEALICYIIMKESRIA